MSPQTIEHKKDHDMMLEIQVLVWDRHKHVAELNRLMGSQYFAYQIQSNLPYRSPLSNGHFETRPTNITI